MKYQFFGDTHGEVHWKQLLDPECIQVFLGDYFSPYKLQTQEECKNNLLEILQLKEEKPDTVLLYGNHDFDILFGEGYSRLDIVHIKENRELFDNNKSKFQIAFAVGDYLITHAGVTSQWKEKYLKDVNNNPQDLVNGINALWDTGKFQAFDFRSNADYWDYYGESVQHGPLWVRWNTLCQWNVFKGTSYKQIVGHTLDRDFRYCPNKKEWNLACIDCLAFQPKSLILDI